MREAQCALRGDGPAEQTGESVSVLLPAWGPGEPDQRDEDRSGERAYVVPSFLGQPVPAPPAHGRLGADEHAPRSRRGNSSPACSGGNASAQAHQDRRTGAGKLPKDMVPSADFVSYARCLVPCSSAAYRRSNVGRNIAKLVPVTT